MSTEPEAMAPSSSTPGTFAMQHGHRPSTAEQVPSGLKPEVGWHFLHVFYQVDRATLRHFGSDERAAGRIELERLLGKHPESGPDQMQCFAVPGHKADFGVMMAGTDLRAIHDVQQAIQASTLGPALKATDSFYSITEISEYVPDVEQYGKILREREGVDPESAVYKTKVSSYASRLEGMNRQRLYPDFPDWPCMCFYPMSKVRETDRNWYLLGHQERSELMSQHAKSGMKFAGKVSQLITASTGLDDWEWGVTLWARNPTYLKDIVYTMRFDESSAKYALFGRFYFGYILSPAELIGAIHL